MTTTNYGGTMTSENLAGKISARIWPAYLKMGKDESGKRPATIALGIELHAEFIKLMENRNYNATPGPGQDLVPKNRLMDMKIIYDDNLADDEWELRWA